MQYKIVRIAGMHYTKAIQNCYENHLALATKTYVEQQKVLFGQALNYFDSFMRGMQALGNEACEIIYDIELLQKQWAKENGVFFTKNNWQEEILLAQIASFKPDVLYFQDIYGLSSQCKRHLKSLFPFLKLIVIFRGFPQADTTLLSHLKTADLVFVGSPHLRDPLRTAGFNCHLVYHFFDPLLLNLIPESPPLYDFSFIGSSGYGYGAGHKDRYWFLTDLIEKSHLQLWVDEQGHYVPKTLLQKCKRKARNLIKASLKRVNPSLLKTLPLPGKFHNLANECIQEKTLQIPLIPLAKLYPRRCKEPVFGLQMYDLLKKSKITFNKHSNPAEGYVDNIRLFQATGMGACLLTDSGSNMKDLFEEDREVVTYKNVDECLEKVHFLLTNEKERSSIAKAGQARTLRDHTSLKRTAEMHDLIVKQMKKIE